MDGQQYPPIISSGRLVKMLYGTSLTFHVLKKTAGNYSSEILKAQFRPATFSPSPQYKSTLAWPTNLQKWLVQ